MKKNRSITFILLAFITIQFVLVLTSAAPFNGDSMMYDKLARECLANGTFYPAAHNLHDDYIIAPVYINYLILILSIYNSPLTIFFGNILLNTLTAWLLYLISRRLFNNKVALITLILYTGYLSGLGAIMMNMTELLFTLLLVAGFYLWLVRKPSALLASGVLFGLAFGIRQGALAMLLALLITTVINKIPLKTIFYLLAGFILATAGLGLYTLGSTGHVIITSTTGPVNVMMGAHDDATGAYDHTVFEPRHAGYIDDPVGLTFTQKAQFWGNQSTTWISQHPLKWIAIMPLKLVHMFIWDDWSLPSLLKNNDWNLYLIAKRMMTGKKLFANESKGFITVFILVNLVHHLYYFTLLFLMIFQFRYYHHYLQDISRTLLPIYLFSLISMGMVLLAFGAARFKYPFFIMMLITLAPMIEHFFNKRSLFFAKEIWNSKIHLEFTCTNKKNTPYLFMLLPIKQQELR